jgi:AraC family L-rhamnose operon regulatory protein RhaS
VGPSTLAWFILDVGVRRPNQEWVWPSWLPMSQPDLQRLTQLLSHNERPVWPANRALIQAFSRLDKTLRGGGTQPLSRIAICVTEVLIELAELLEQHDLVLDPRLSSTERTVDLFLQTLSDRLAEDWTVDRMAKECGLGRTRFVHYCRQRVNVTPLELLQDLRIRRATELLSAGELSVLDVALLCGYQSSQYFATVYRRHTGKTPTEAQQGASTAAPVLEVAQSRHRA